MASAAPKVSWIAAQWKRGWKEIPLLMAAHCVTTPILLILIGGRLTNTFRFPNEPAKYRTEYTVIRPDDPRVALINHHASIDKVGVFS